MPVVWGAEHRPILRQLWRASPRRVVHRMWHAPRLRRALLSRLRGDHIEDGQCGAAACGADDVETAVHEDEGFVGDDWGPGAGPPRDRKP